MSNHQTVDFHIAPSLSARRAWIEMWVLRKVPILGIKSLSARRAWIEIYYADKDVDWVRVALRKESVDRNFDTVQIVVVIV